MEKPGPSTSLSTVDHITGEPTAPEKPTPKKRKIADPAYVPVKNEYSSDDGDDEHDGIGLYTPKRTPRKRKANTDPDDETRSTSKTSSQAPKRKKLVVDSVQIPSPANTPANNTLNPGKGLLEVGDMVSNADCISLQLEHGAIGDTTNRTRRAVSDSATDLYSPATTTDSHGSHDPTGDGPLSPLDLMVSVKKRKREDDNDQLAFKPHHSEDEKEEDNTFRISKNEKTGVVFDFSVEKARRWAEAINLPDGVYNNEESDLFFRLAMRGFEPLVPRHWKYDFPTLPALLFPSPDEKSETLIQALEGSNFYGVKSLYHLFSLGGRVRDCRILKTSPEMAIMRYVKRYIRWAVYDSKVHIRPSAIPVYTIYGQKKGESTLSAVKKLNQRLQLLANRFQGSFNKSATFGRPSSPPISDGASSASSFHARYPLLVGFVVCGPIIAILTLSSDPSSRARTTDSKFISQFDMSERGQDVWNSLAIAITVMKIRKTMVQLASDKVGGYGKLPRDSSPISDKDL